MTLLHASELGYLTFVFIVLAIIIMHDARRQLRDLHDEMIRIKYDVNEVLAKLNKKK